MIDRRGFITGLVSFVAAPAIVRVGSIMPVKVMEPTGSVITMEQMEKIWLAMAEKAVRPPVFFDGSALKTAWNGREIEFVRVLPQEYLR